MLNKPDMVQNSILAMLKEFKGLVFLERHSYLPYYTSALAFNQLEKLFREEKITKDLRSFKPHLLMMFREAIGGTLPPVNETKLIDEHSQKILRVLKNPENSTGIFIQVADLFKQARDKWINELKKSPYGMKDIAEFTKILLETTGKGFSIKAVKFEKSERIIDSTVLFTLKDRNEKWYGFISGSPDNIFFHENYNKGLDFKSLKGKKVEYKLGRTKDGKVYAFDTKITE
jgi:hypothetical protein